VPESLNDALNRPSTAGGVLMDKRASDRADLPSDWLLTALIFAVPLMKPAIHEPVIVADLLFLLLAASLAIETLLKRRALRWLPGFGTLLLYVGSLAPSLLASTDLGTSAFKFATEFYLIALAAIPLWIIDSEERFRRAVLAWLAGTAVVCLSGLLGLAAFASGHPDALFGLGVTDFGSLPPGPYPRLALTFFNFNMACNYLTGSLALALLAWRSGYIRGGVAIPLLFGIAFSAALTISPGLGGIALLAGWWFWLTQRSRWPLIAPSILCVAIVVAALFLLAVAFTFAPHDTAPFVVHGPASLTIYPAPRLMTWTAALVQFARHPLIGTGLGIGPVDVLFHAPSDALQELTDAHNVFLSIAAQAGIIGLLGLCAIIRLAWRTTVTPGASGAPVLRTLVVGAAVLNMLVYQGFGGSFEDTRHLWLLFGLLLAAARIERL
jgi:putative inorganic carbon (hco3(-)) transporter